jgi:hypoxanthine phosphoribosyltransferase
MPAIPSHLKPLYTAEMIRSRTAELGASISVWAEEVWKTSHTDLLAIPVLRGGIFFYADLVRQIRTSVEIAPARTWAYEQKAEDDAPERKPNELASVQVDLGSVPARGRSVLVVDDICDSGRSLAVLSAALKDAGAREVKAAVLVTRKVENQAYAPAWSGFDYAGKEWIVGYGMDDSERWRNLPGVFIITQA